METKKSWMHPRSNAIVRRTDRQGVRVTKIMSSADCLTDHRPVVSKFNLTKTHPVMRPQSKKAPKRLDVSTLNQDSIRQAFLNDICNQIFALF